MQPIAESTDNRTIAERPLAYRLHRDDNVATLLADAAPGEVRVIGDGPQLAIAVAEPVREGHKVALQPITEGAPIIKHAVAIGLATAAISAGSWVHLHNCRSQLDERSSHLDLASGAPMDTVYE